MAWRRRSLALSTGRIMLRVVSKGSGLAWGSAAAGEAKARARIRTRIGMSAPRAATDDQAAEAGVRRID